MPLSDSSQTYMRAVWPKPSPAALRLGLAAGVSEVSRFSCMKFLGVLWGLRLRRTERELALSLPLMLPSAHYKERRRPDCIFSELNTHPTYSPVYASLVSPRDTQRKTRGRVDRYSFLVRLFHPLLHAGLARRTVMAILRQLRANPRVRSRRSYGDSFGTSDKQCTQAQKL